MLLKAAVKNKTSISITPLIDVVFILLLFFMLSSTFQRTKQIEIKTSLLGVKAKEESNKHKLLLDLNNVIIIDSVRYSLDSEEFENYLKKFSENNDHITLAANPRVETQKFIQLLDRVSSAGLTKLNISKTELP